MQKYTFKYDYKDKTDEISIASYWLQAPHDNIEQNFAIAT